MVTQERICPAGMPGGSDVCGGCVFKYKVKLGIIGLALLAAGPGLVMASGVGGKKILVVHSYHETQKGHVVEMTEGIEEAFAGTGVRLDYFHMDTKRRTDPAWKTEAGILAAREMDRIRPDVVIAMDDNAQEYFVTRQMGLDNAPVFVFGGVNAEISDYGYPRSNVTGVLERPNIRESLELLLKIKPGIKRIAMLSDKSRTTDLFVSYCRTLDLPAEVVGFAQVLTLDEWERAIDTYKDRVDAFGLYALRTVREGPGDADHVPESRLVDILNRRAGLPTVGFFDTAARSGVLCGISVSMKEQGYAAGAMALAILEGRPVSDFPIVPTGRGRIQLNLRTAEALDLPIDWKIISKADVLVK